MKHIAVLFLLFIIFYPSIAKVTITEVSTLAGTGPTRTEYFICF